MNIQLNRSDAVNGVITIEIEKSDYADEVKKSLKELNKSVSIHGFRKGMAPPQLLRKQYGASIIAEEINKLVSKSLTDYIKDSDFKILGEPLPVEDRKPLDLDNEEDFSLSFDVGLSPEIDIKLTKDDKVPFYTIQVSDEMIDKQIENFKAQNGSRVDVEEVEAKDLVRGELLELDENGVPKENGIVVERAVVMPQYVKTEEEKAKFTGAKLNSTIVFNPQKAYEGNEAELSSLLNIKKEEVKNYTGDFSFEIAEISRYKEAELNQELFDKIFEPGLVDSEEVFREKVKENISKQLTAESEYKFLIDMRSMMEEKVPVLQLPEAFLKRWLLASNEKNTPESVDEEFPTAIKDLKFHLIKEQLYEDNGIEIGDDDLKEYARKVVRSQFAQYGMYEVPDELLEKYSQEMLDKKEANRSIGDKVFEDKLIRVLKEQITLEPKEISIEDFQKMFN